MTTHLEFTDSAGSESIAPVIERYDGPVPTTGDTVYLFDNLERFRIVRRLFYYYLPAKPGSPGILNVLPCDVKVSLHCERLPEGSFY